MTQGTTVVNVTEQSWTLHRSYGTYRVRGYVPASVSSGLAEAGGTSESYALTPIIGVRAVMDLGDKRIVDVPISAREIAEDLCREINADAGEDSFFGVFVAQGEKPSEKELADARKRLEAFYRSQVAGADREWERSHSYLFINDVQRRAAKHLKLEKDWFYQPHETFDCPGCGEKVRAGVAVCKTCHAVLDREKAARLGLGLTATSAAPEPSAPSRK